MTCPRCKRSMQEIEEGGATIDVCTSCRGTFLDAGEAEHFVADAEMLRAALQAPRLDPQTGHPCPRCGAVTSEAGFLREDYRLELCDGCGGIWFASKQLSRLKSVVADTPIPRAAPAAKHGKKKRGAETAASRAASKGAPARFECPSCHEPPTVWDRWKCSCGWVFDAFAANGRCPKCDKKWDRTRCPRCGASHPYDAWAVRPH